MPIFRFLVLWGPYSSLGHYCVQLSSVVILYIRVIFDVFPLVAKCSIQNFTRGEQDFPAILVEKLWPIFFPICHAIPLAYTGGISKEPESTRTEVNVPFLSSSLYISTKAQNLLLKRLMRISKTTSFTVTPEWQYVLVYSNGSAAREHVLPTSAHPLQLFFTTRHVPNFK